ncbi:tripeptidyl-peptidase 2-like isoform X1 [Arachis hypogaea]|uniref:tripeptidyl-peptidase 2-like isoform X1 n=4 Tax=Arachis TaxID=3817 RepID=UPI003B21A0F3
MFHGVKVNQEEIVLDGSEAPVRINAEALLASKRLAPLAILNKIRIPYRPTDAKISALTTDRDKLPSGKQILALTLTVLDFAYFLRRSYRSRGEASWRLFENHVEGYLEA